MRTNGCRLEDLESDNRGKCSHWQSAMGGGSIGLELTGAVSRPFMLRWDTLYRENLKKASQDIDLDLDLVMYERYVDDSNQLAIIPPPGARYDANSKRVVIDIGDVDKTVSDDERTARLYTDIANDVMPGIVMEFDVPSRNDDNKMAILDMKVWLDEDKNIMFQHFENPQPLRISCMHCQHSQYLARTVSIHRNYCAECSTVLFS